MTPLPAAAPRATTPEPAAPIGWPPASLGYPPTARVPMEETLHGRVVADPYRWLEGASPDVAAWAARQDAFARRYLGAVDGREVLAARLNELLRLDTLSPPHRAGDRDFYLRRKADQEMAVLCVRDPAGGEQVLVDPHTLADDGRLSLGAWVPSHDGARLAFSLHEHGADDATLLVMEVATGEVRAADRIEGAAYAHPSWTPEGNGFYYTWLPPEAAVPNGQRLAAAEVRFHALGTDAGCDRVVRAPTGDPEILPQAHLSRDGRWLIVTESSLSGDAVWYCDRSLGDREWVPFTGRVGARVAVQAWGDCFVVVTDLGAARGRVLRADPTRRGEAWEEIVPEPADGVLAGAGLVGGQLVLTYVCDAVATIEVRSLSGKLAHRIALPSIGSASAVAGVPERDEAYVQFSSFLHPPEVLRLSVKTGRAEVWSRAPGPGGRVDASGLTVERVRYPSRDGTAVPMFLVHHRELRRDRSTPFLLIGYGGFGVTMSPVFDPTLYPWLEAGGGVAVAGVRGGGEGGEDWHRAGMRGAKQNSVDDFIAAAEYLVSQGYTAPQRLAIEGGSNGGLLVGAALTQRPELFAAAVCADPLLDMLRYHRFGQGRAWVPEYGSPEDPDAFAWLHAYSPYHRVRSGAGYPATLLTVSGSDDRVNPLHARKMAAALQAAGARGPVLLRIAPTASHGAAARIERAVETWTDIYAFLFGVLGMALPA